MCIKLLPFDKEDDIGEGGTVDVVAQVVQELLLRDVVEGPFGRGVCVQDVDVFQVVLAVGATYNEEHAVDECHGVAGAGLGLELGVYEVFELGPLCALRVEDEEVVEAVGVGP